MLNDKCQSVPVDGAGLIAAERRRQIEVEGYDQWHDNEHQHGQLLMAAGCYMGVIPSHQWPWFYGYKPKDRVTDLVRAGAMIAAEIDRLLRLDEQLPTNRQS